MNKMFAWGLACLMIAACDASKPAQPPIAQPTSSGVGHTVAVQDSVTPYGPRDVIHSAMRDRAGNLWFGTLDRGAYCYDGKRFIHYSTANGLCNNEVATIYEDKATNVLFGTGDGLCRFDRSDFDKQPMPMAEEVKLGILQPSMHATTADPGSYDRLVTSVLQDNHAILWMAVSGHGVYRYDGYNFTNFLNKDSTASAGGRHLSVIQCMHQDRAGNLWFGSFSADGLWRYDGQAWTHFMPSDGLADDMITCITEDKSGALWFGTRDHGVSRWDGERFQTLDEQDGLCNDQVSSILQDRGGNMWFTSSVKNGTRAGGICMYDGRAYTRLSAGEGLENNDFFCSVEDASGHIWFGGRYGRLFRYDGKSFEDFSEEVH